MAVFSFQIEHYDDALKVQKEGKDQESIQSNTCTTSDPGY